MPLIVLFERTISVRKMLQCVEITSERRIPISNGKHVILYRNRKPGGRTWKRIVITPLDVKPDIKKTQHDVSETLKTVDEIIHEADAFLNELETLV